MLRPIRIAHVALQLGTGGMERLLAEFSKHADRNHVSLCFVALGAGGIAANEIASDHWPVILLDRLSGLRPSTVFSLANIFRNRQIDVVHTHNSKPLLYAGSAARLAGVGEIVHTCHGRRQHATARQHLAFKVACGFADRIVCVSNDIAGLCEDQRIGNRKIRTIPNGVDSRRFSFNGPAVDGKAVYVGRLSPEKDVASLIKATAIAASRGSTFGLRIAGDGTCREELIALATSLGIGSKVEFLGEVQDIPALLRVASMLVLPSLTEGMPLTVLEAMSSGLPVIATRVGGIPELVKHEVTGLLVPPGNPEHLADALLCVHNDPQRAREMGQAGRKKVQDGFEVRRMVSAYESMYLEVLQGKQSSKAQRRAG
jgi:glycosyltransferase involved in cell wall biosynthesis